MLDTPKLTLKEAPMPDLLTLRLTQVAESDGQYRVELALEGAGSRQTANARFAFAVTEQERKELRWYLEDYLQDPHDPAPTIAARIEQRMVEIGTELFQKVFESNRDVTRLWACMFEHLAETRVEIITEVRDATAIPWELLHDPQTDTPLALRASSFVRTLSNPVQPPKLPSAAEKIRILLVICRPKGDNDVPFRSVASRLIKELSEEARATFDLHVLRPPTFEQLGRELRAAKARGEPYHIVHFDGHGVYDEYRNGRSVGNQSRQTDYRRGKRGYLVFENHALAHNFELVSGLTLGKVLIETDVPVLVLNACRSAHAEHVSDVQTSANVGVSARADREGQHERMQVFGSLAQEVMDAGAAGVVAMRYNVYVVTAAQFVTELYATLTQGLSLGEAVSRGRKNLADQPLREVVVEPLPLADWSVPVVYEAAPVTLFPKLEHTPQLTIMLNPAMATPTTTSISSNVPSEPDAGFFGRDETLLALDRAFDTQPVVLLQAYAGSGKTTTAAEFARWYALTGGIDGPVLWTSFEQYIPLPRVLDTLGRVFEPLLEQSNIQWLTLTDDQRREAALYVLSLIPVLWIWDNVEPIAGFPSGTPSVWSEQEQRELADFLWAARRTQAKFLLTSRRDERGWLGDLSACIQMPPMPLQERKQLARALAEKHGWKPNELGVFHPLLVYTQGNPLTITVLVGQAVRDGLRTKQQIDDFLDHLRAGEDAFEDEIIEGRTKSLGASLSYGFEHAFTVDESKILALLHFFQGFLNVDALGWMSHPEIGKLPEVRNLTRETSITLLERATEVGLLIAYGSGYYAIHPALPWYFKSLFEQYYVTDEQQQAATRAFVEAIGMLSSYYHDRYSTGTREAINILEAEEGNLLYTQQLARSNGWWSTLVKSMQGLRMLYDHTGRRATWRRLVDEIVSEYVDPITDEALPGREDYWRIITQYRVHLARQARNWKEVEHLQRTVVERDRQVAMSMLPLPADSLDGTQRNTLRTLAVSLHDLGEIQREIGQAECVIAYEEAFGLSKRTGNTQDAAICAFNLGNAYKNIPTIRDLAQAKHWYQYSLELQDKRDGLGRGRCLHQLGGVFYEYFLEGRAKNHLLQELLDHLNNALQFFYNELELLPSNAMNELAAAHHALGLIYQNVGDIDRALPHYRESIRYEELQNNFYGAGETRFNVAFTLVISGRFEDALLYAQAALRNFETYGTGAAEIIQKTQRLIAIIKEDMQRKT